MTAPDDVRARFEARVRDWPNYSERTLVRDGRCPEYYGNPVVQGAWEGYRAAHADLSGEVRELVEAHRIALATIDDYLAYEHDGDPWKEDARAMGEMDINDFATDGRLERCRAALAKFHPTHQEKP